jgi:hypothetical protein
MDNRLLDSRERVRADGSEERRRRVKECKQAGYMYSVRGWHLHLGWGIAFASALQRQGGRLVFRACTDLLNKEPIKHSFQGTETVNQGITQTVH